MKKSVIGSFVMAALLALTSCGAKETNEIKIGGIFPLSGAVAVYGVECKNGIDLAIEEINAAGGINGKNVVLIKEILIKQLMLIRNLHLKMAQKLLLVH